MFRIDQTLSHDFGLAEQIRSEQDQAAALYVYVRATLLDYWDDSVPLSFVTTSLFASDN